jgi:hypothetical protein
VGGEWVKQPEGAKGREIWRPQEKPDNVRIVCVSWKRLEVVPNLLQQGVSCEFENFYHPSCRGIFHDLVASESGPSGRECRVDTGC